MPIHNRSIAVIGASSFIGRHLIKKLSTLPGLELKLLLHNNTFEGIDSLRNVSIVSGDLLQPERLTELLKPGCTVINLAFLRNSSEDDNTAVINNIIDISCKSKIKRLVHCSTAVVAGSATDRTITETTECHPMAGYEHTKLKIEDILRTRAIDNFELAILRPTAVFGSGGKNLIKLADELRTGNRFVSYLRSCLHDKRRMNLVCVDNVVSAIILLSNIEEINGIDTFIISDDDVPLNNYRDIEKMFMEYMGYKDYAFPRVIMPRPMLSLLLKLAGRSNINPDRIYESQNLPKVGYKKSMDFKNGIYTFIDSYMKLHKFGSVK